jgi:hypothetical protein
MGLDQNLYEYHRNIMNPTEPEITDITYWRKDWDLQQFIDCYNCETIEVTKHLCLDILGNLDNIYAEDPYYREQTKEAFTKALNLVEEGREVYYEPWW